MCHLNRKTRLFLSTALHVVILLHHSLFPLYAAYTVRYIDEPLKTRLMQYTWAYLTYWNFSFQIMFLLLAAGCDAAECMGSANAVLYKKMKHWRDVTFTGLVVPLTMFVTIMFWSLYWIDRELVFPQIYDLVVPWWFNHSVHTNTFFVIVLETLLQPRRKTVDPKIETMFYVGVSVSYAVLYYSIFFVAGVWLYQVFAIMTWWQVCIFQIMIWFSTHIFYKIQFPINRFIHGSDGADEDVIDADSKNVVESLRIRDSNNTEKGKNVVTSRL